MKKYLGYVVIILFGVLSIVMLMERSDSINNSVTKGSNVVELFA